MFRTLPKLSPKLFKLPKESPIPNIIPSTSQSLSFKELANSPAIKQQSSEAKSDLEKKILVEITEEGETQLMEIPFEEYISTSNTRTPK